MGMTATERLRALLDERGVDGSRSGPNGEGGGRMSITDELRKYAGRLSDEAARKSEHGFSPIAMALEGIADRIDAEHESAMYNMRREFEEWKHTQDTCYVKLPKDADGVPIHIGDKVDSDHYEDGTVTGIQYGLAANGAIRELVAVQPNGWDVATWRDPDEYAHHHEPTVEDVLREFAYGLGVPVADSYIAASAAKLRLAGDAE